MLCAIPPPNGYGACCATRGSAELGRGICAWLGGGRNIDLLVSIGGAMCGGEGYGRDADIVGGSAEVAGETDGGGA